MAGNRYVVSVWHPVLAYSQAFFRDEYSRATVCHTATHGTNYALTKVYKLDEATVKVHTIHVEGNVLNTVHFEGRLYGITNLNNVFCADEEGKILHAAEYGSLQAYLNLSVTT